MASENLPGRASRQDLTPRQRELQRLFMRVLPKLRRLGALRHEVLRRLSGRPHAVDFFHQVDDPYSQLALAAIPRLTARYAVRFRFHLVSATDRLHAPEPELLAAYARRDCGWIAPHYGLDFPREAPKPDAERVRAVERLLAARLAQDDFLETALSAGRDLWGIDGRSGAAAPSTAPGAAPAPTALAREAETDRVLAEGNALRARRRHYSGGMFWHAGDWYWGVDRICHLERRLVVFGALKKGEDASKPCFPRPPLDPGPVRDSGRLALEIFPSLRSPYTAIILEKSLELARAANVAVALRPVMPMVMRGVPAPSAKGLYIMLDANREAEAMGVAFGDMYDPIGRAVVRGFSLWPFARTRGREAEYLAAFLRAAFVEGQPTGTDEGIRRVVESAGLDWNDARPHLDSDEAIAELEANRVLLYDELGLWGVPSYRLRGPAGEPDLCVWGQDRLWLVAAEIRRRLA